MIVEPYFPFSLVRTKLGTETVRVLNECKKETQSPYNREESENAEFGATALVSDERVHAIVIVDGHEQEGQHRDDQGGHRDDPLPMTNVLVFCCIRHYGYGRSGQNQQSDQQMAECQTNQIAVASHLERIDHRYCRYDEDVAHRANGAEK